MLDNEILEKVLDSLPDLAIIVIDKNYRYKFARGPLNQRLGYTRERMEGKTMYEVLITDYWDLLEPFYERVFNDESFTSQFDGEGDNADFFCRFLPIKNKENEIEYALVVAQDMIELNKEIYKKADKLKSDFSNRLTNALYKTTVNLIDNIQNDVPKSELLKSANVILKQVTLGQAEAGNFTGAFND